MRSVCEYAFCTGCAACLNACPTHAISMEEDQKGFRYPAIDPDKCVSCGKCEAVCPEKHLPAGQAPKEVYAALAKDDIERKKSSSGGVFACLARQTIKQGGSVFGVLLDQDLTVRHAEIRDLKDLDLLRGSKYVQSEVGLSFQQVRQRLQEGKKVLFSGTPCQVAGLKNYLQKDYPDLLTVDILCHGVPSPGLFRKYVQSEEAVSGSRMTDIQFRSKRIGWKKFFTVRTFADGTEATWADTFVPGFLQNLYLRDSCYSCRFTTSERQGDITLGDYWEYSESAPAYLEDDDKGISLVLVNSARGEQAFSAIHREIATSRKTLENAKAGNPVLYVPCSKAETYDCFWEDAKRMPWSELAEKYIVEQDTEEWISKEQRDYFDIPFRKRQWKHRLRRIAGASLRRVERLIRKH